MQTDGLISREPNPDDARSTMVCLLPAGRAAIEKAAPGHVQDVRRNFVDLFTPAELDMLAALNERILHHLAKDDDSPAERRALIGFISGNHFSPRASQVFPVRFALKGGAEAIRDNEVTLGRNAETKFGRLVQCWPLPMRMSSALRQTTRPERTLPAERHYWVT